MKDKNGKIIKYKDKVVHRFQWDGKYEYCEFDIGRRKGKLGLVDFSENDFKNTFYPLNEESQEDLEII